MNRLRPNRFRITPLLLCFAVLAAAASADTLEFSGPIVVPWNDDLLCGAVVPTADGARDQLVVGTAAGWVRLLRPSNTGAETFNFVGQLLAQGRVVSMERWEGRPAASPGVVICTANPDRVIFAEVVESYPYLNRVGSVDLVEDPGGLVFLDDGQGSLETIAVSLPGIDQIALLHLRDGAWSAGETLAAGDRPISLAAVNLDGDEEKELVAVNQGALSRSLGRYDRQEDGSWNMTRTLAVDGNPEQARVLDWDGDGQSEVFVMLTDSRRVVGYDASGTELVELTSVDLPFEPRGFVLAGGGSERTDVFSYTHDRQLLDHRSAPGNASQPVTYFPGGQTEAVLACDFNGDTLVDLAVLGGTGQYASILYGTPNGTHWGFPALDLPPAAGPSVLADFDGDSRRDLVVASYVEQRLACFQGADGGFEFAPDTIPIGFSAGALAAIQLDADEAMELAAYHTATGRVELYDHTRGDWAPQEGFQGETAWSGLLAADLDGDGLQDLLGYSRSTRSVAAYFGLGGAAFTERVDWSLAQPIHELECVDLNVDGRLDLVQSDGVSKVWFATHGPDRTLGEPDFVFAGAGASELARGDFDLDGDFDIVVGNRDDDSISVLENPGTGELVRRVGSFSLVWSFDDIVCADVDDVDGAEILLLQRERRSLGISFGLGDWQFSPAAEYPLFSAPNRLLVNDVNGDGTQDLLVLDNLNDLGFVLPNSQREIVAVEDPLLAARCDGVNLEVRVHPNGPVDWWLDLLGGSGPLPLAWSGGAWLGTQDYEGGEWLMRIPVEDLVGLDEATRPRLRLRWESGGENGAVEIGMPSGCEAPGMPSARLAWARRPGPNPFNPQVSFVLNLVRSEELTVDVFDLAGGHVHRLAEGVREAGRHPFVWNGEGPRGRVAAGAYFVLARTESEQLVSKVLLLK